MSEQPRYHDVAALHQPHLVRRAHRRGFCDEATHPGTGGVHRRARVDDARLAAAAQRCTPAGAARRQPLTARASEDGGAARLRIECVQHHESRIVGLRVGVHEAAPVPLLERLAGDMRAQVDGCGPRQVRACGQVIVEKQAGADHPRRAQVCGVRHDEAQRAHDVRRRAEQHLALLQRLAHQGEVELLEITQAAVDQLGAGGGGVCRQIVLLAQQYFQPASGRVAGDPYAVDSPTDDQQVVAWRRRVAHARRGACWP